eukprot:1054857-Alexandrium_andersonii.AAC.1
MALALRRAVSNGAAENLGMTLQLDVASKTVRRWEVAFRAAQLAFVRAWYVQMEALRLDPSIPGLSFGVH